MYFHELWLFLTSLFLLFFSFWCITGVFCMAGGGAITFSIMLDEIAAGAVRNHIDIHPVRAAVRVRILMCMYV